MSRLLDGNRKILAYVLALGALVGMAFAGLTSEGPYWAVVGALAAFSGGNVGEHLAARRSTVAGDGPR